MRKSRFRWIFSVLLVSAIFFGCGRKPGEKLYHEALAEWNDGNLARARALLEKSIRRRAGSAENAEAYNRLGVLLWEMGNSKDAVDAFNESIRMDAGQYDVLCNLGVALSSQNDFTAAERAFREASLIKADDPRPLAFAGVSYARNQRWNDAANNLNRALGRTPKDPCLQTALALAELHTTGAESALKRLQAVAKQYPDYAPAFFNTASIYRYWVKNQTEAKRWFELYLNKVPADSPFAAQARAQLQAIAAGDNGEKLTFTPPRSPNRIAADKNFEKALEYQKKNDFDNAIKWYIKAVEEDDTYEQAFYNLGLAYYAANRIGLASDAFARAVQLNPAFTSARYNCALAEYRLGHNDRALRELEMVISQQPKYQPAIDLRARIKK
ncbi:MAG TPA: tetratricopeptide repeat protein [Pontiellaceae bacterium]|nr:tetratricopeptide repeat protein [Pontiellaceae bacterium]HPR83435.1 tetratricopeptide repeat protein [Pontiellaceae bacterium]